MRGSGASTASWPRPATRSRADRGGVARTGTACSRFTHGHVPRLQGNTAAASARGRCLIVDDGLGIRPRRAAEILGDTRGEGAGLSFSRQLAVDAAADNVRVNVIAPGSVRTPPTAPVYAEDGEDDGRPVVPHAIQPRLGEPEEIAAAICFLLGRGELRHVVARGRRRRRDGDLTMAGLADPFSLGPPAPEPARRDGARDGAGRDGRALPGDADYWRRRAEGGIAMAIIGGTCVAPESQDRYGIVFEAFREDAVPDLRARADAIKAEEPLPSSRSCTSDARRSARRRGTPRSRPRRPPSREPVAVRPLTLDEIGEVIQAFVRTSANVAEGGFDGVDLRCARVSPGAVPVAGGEHAHRPLRRRPCRVRLLAETISIRALDTGIAVGVRLSIEPGLDVEELAAITAVLGETARPDWLNITVGPRGEYVKDMATERPPLLGDFGPIREAAAATPLIVSHAFRARGEIEDALAQGADLVGMARPLIADADFPRKLLEGRDGDPSLRELQRGLPAVHARAPARSIRISRCRRASPAREALARAGRGGARRGRRRDRRRRPRGARVRGDARARGTRRRGAVEAGVELGGASRLPLARRTGRWRRILDFWSAGLESDRVDVRLGVSPGAEELASATEVVVATGSRETPPEIPASSRRSGHGSSSPPVRRGSRTPERVVVVDDGFGWWPGVSAVELAIAGRGGDHDADAVGRAGDRPAARAGRSSSRGSRERASRPAPSSCPPASSPPASRFGTACRARRISCPPTCRVRGRAPAGRPGWSAASARVQLIGDAVMRAARGARDRRGRAAADAILGR